MNKKTELPRCRHRGKEVQPGVYECKSEGLKHNGTVPVEICLRCPVLDIPNRQQTKTMPSFAQRGWNLLNSLAAFAADGFKTVSKEEYQQRLEICNSCDERTGDWCTQCGCQLSAKSTGRAFECPLGKWYQTAQKQQPCTLTADQYQILIKSFRRFHCLRRLVESIKFWYPTARIIVADDSFEQLPSELPHDAQAVKDTPGVEWLQLPFDVGLGAGRNRMVEHATAQYLILCDDDYIFTEETRIEDLIRILDDDPTVGIAGGCVRVDGKSPEEWVGHYPTKSGQVEPLTTPWVTIAGIECRQTDLIHNFYAARRETLLLCPWDDQFKIIGEHVDHFLTVKANGVKVVYTRAVMCGHWRENLDGYSEFRMRTEYWDQYREKWNLEPPGHLNQKIEGFADQVVAEAFAKQQGAESHNLVVLGVGHSGTTIVTKMLSALGWNLGPADDGYAEHVPIREINDRLLAGESFPAGEAEQLLSELPRPWAIKDPRFVRTLDQWQPALKSHQPTLVWITRDLEETKASYRRRGEGKVDGEEFDVIMTRGQTIEGAHMAAAEIFRTWPWGKIHVKYEQLQAAVRLFDKNWTHGEARILPPPSDPQRRCA